MTRHTQKHSQCGCAKFRGVSPGHLPPRNLPICLRVDMGVKPPMPEADRIAALLKEGKALRLILRSIHFGIYVLDSPAQKAQHNSGPRRI